MKTFFNLLTPFLLLAISCSPEVIKPQIKEVTIFPVRFIFVNKQPSDSIRSVLLDANYYNSCLDSTYLNGAAFGKNSPNKKYEYRDSIMYKEFKACVGSKYYFEINISWRYDSVGYKVVNGYSYCTRTPPDVDTLTKAMPTDIIFRWPNDTSNFKLVKHYHFIE